MAADVLILRIAFGLSLALLIGGAAAAWVSDNALKRIAGGVVAALGALSALAALGAPAALSIAGAAVLFAHVAFGAALAVRLQESYGAVEAPELDRADSADETAEPTP
ncbi:MAG TPA: hypothetical protein VEA80_16905 [Vitreimonas sp.]|uniref:hypothetical protein n=1 Tax=Vitreimonas sp. TaxID=3069702 RepID=UPI002D738A62|nr:hypothetical protein [Vitreimonas sp.]HYD89160.1 hypothetical protein [Vitreimonas sp.]